ncbi:NADH-quinone oxidoreductase subunit N [Salidesulfovibrio onnuriiensis]|uniref:NADH-quinone oxidoreductase subunit N n=1 Tax=Salidesulfovibrio onnuriiensis TaxID=2583823 RepID=UPI0011C76985|nr:NADH-quinone oxidoreductase subunit N [Salidesulfovibrio onnuriiensis]
MKFDILLVLPELALLLVAALLFVTTLMSRKSEDSLSCTAWLPVGALAVLGVSLLSLGRDGTLFSGTYRVDMLSQFFKAAIAAGFVITSMLVRRNGQVSDNDRPDYLMLLTISAWGLMLMSSAVDLITIYVAMEISSYSLYAAIPLRAQDKRAAEAGIKYIMFGALATALALYGYSWILAGQHTGMIAELAGKDWTWASSPLACTGLLLFLCGLFFKLALFPFHFWCPDVYQGTGNETAAFAATMPKLGAAAVLVRLAALLTPDLEITHVIAAFTAVSMTLGNLSALTQTDLKRMLGYSSVAHAGYLGLGIVSGTTGGLGAASFYALVYLLMNLACFWVVCQVAEDGENPTYTSLNGLHKKSPLLAFVLAVAAFALVGLPPTAGFMGKLFLLTSAWGAGYEWLVIVAVLNTAIAIYYYLSLVRHAYTEQSEQTEPAGETFTLGMGPRLAGAVMALSILLLGVAASPVYDLAVQAGTGLLR